MVETSSASLFRLNIEVGDIDRAKAFYDALLVQDGRTQMGRSYYAAGSVTLQVVQAAHPQPGPKALYFAVEDLDAAHVRAVALNCLSSGDLHGLPSGEPHVRPWGERSFYCTDPWQNQLSFVDVRTIYAG